MASGLGKRFGSNKLMEILDNKPVINWVFDATEGLFDKRVVVSRSLEVKNLCNSLNIDCIIHDFPGRNDTVRLGLSSMINVVDYCFFMQGDQPLIQKESVSKLIEVALNNNDKIIRAGYKDKIGAPVGFPRVYFDELLILPEGKGGNWIAKKYPDKVCTVNVSKECELWDIDTVSDLELIRQQLNL